MARPDLFAAIAPICGGGMAWNAEVLNMPIRVFHGAEDAVVAPFHSDNMVEKLRELGKDVSYTRLEGVGHNAWDYAYSDELIRWMLSKKR
jgi:predicted peptidase